MVSKKNDSGKVIETELHGLWNIITSNIVNVSCSLTLNALVKKKKKMRITEIRLKTLDAFKIFLLLIKDFYF